ncbi:hypothetical protein BOX15_Mlig015234g3 [Macrostomum lignano]|uniref:DH domain-containing protein n=1 Tax=Macrostomum lignano TaxID=282301 RepID=A0A267GFE2_9PLAT|nr:hypothetical protein BOX15_Mlig015234g3 [Macrostomum lignano]
MSSSVCGASVAGSDVTPTSPGAGRDSDLAFSLDNLSLLVEDVKDGFAEAMKQLSSIQHQDEEFQRRLNGTEAATSQKMEALQTAVNQMREQLSSVLTRVESLELHQRRLEGQVDRLDRVQSEQQEKLEKQPVMERESAACQTPLLSNPYSCPTPLSPDSGRPGTCTPSCFHGNDNFLPASCCDSQGPTTSSGHVVAEKTLSMSRALAAQQVTGGCSPDCRFDAEHRQGDEEDLTDRLSECSNGGSIISGTTVEQHQKQKVSQQLSDKRRRICQEIVETERRYCSDLWTVIDLIAETLKSASFISMKDLCLIFPKCLPRLYDLHSTFLGLLETQLTDGNAEQSGEIFLANVFLDFLDANNGELFELYRRYANDFGSAVRTIRAYQQHSARFRCLLSSLQRHPSCGGLDLTAFLLTPVQRLPRYQLLMRQLSLHTQQSHGDRLGLDRLLSRLHSLLDELNFSIQTALKQAQQQQQQQQQRWKRSRSLTRSSAVSNCSGGDWTAADEAASGIREAALPGKRCHQSAISTGSGAHFLASNARCRSATPSSGQQKQQATRYAVGLSQFGGSSTALETQACHQQQQQQQQPQQLQRTPRSPATSLGTRSRWLSRQMRSVDRCVSANDILRDTVSPSPSNSPAPSPAPSSASASTFVDDRPRLRRTAGRASAASTVAAGTATTSQLQSAHKSTPTLKESFRRMFQSRRKSSLAKLESLPPPVAANCSATFEDENGDPCTDV